MPNIEAQRLEELLGTGHDLTKEVAPFEELKAMEELLPQLQEAKALREEREALEQEAHTLHDALQVWAEELLGPGSADEDQALVEEEFKATGELLQRIEEAKALREEGRTLKAEAHTLHGALQAWAAELLGPTSSDEEPESADQEVKAMEELLGRIHEAKKLREDRAGLVKETQTLHSELQAWAEELLGPSAEEDDGAGDQEQKELEEMVEHLEKADSEAKAIRKERAKLQEERHSLHGALKAWAAELLGPAAAEEEDEMVDQELQAMEKLLAQLEEAKKLRQAQAELAAETHALHGALQAAAESPPPPPPAPVEPQARALPAPLPVQEDFSGRKVYSEPTSARGGLSGFTVPANFDEQAWRANSVRGALMGLARASARRR